MRLQISQMSPPSGFPGRYGMNRYARYTPPSTPDIPQHLLVQIARPYPRESPLTSAFFSVFQIIGSHSSISQASLEHFLTPSNARIYNLVSFWPRLRFLLFGKALRSARDKLVGLVLYDFEMRRKVPSTLVSTQGRLMRLLLRLLG